MRTDRNKRLLKRTIQGEKGERKKEGQFYRDSYREAGSREKQLDSGKARMSQRVSRSWIRTDGQAEQFERGERERNQSECVSLERSLRQNSCIELVSQGLERKRKGNLIQQSLRLKTF